MSWLFTSGGQSIEASASVSVLPINTQGWCPLGLTGLISLQSKGLSRAFSTPQLKSINSLALSLLYGPTITSIHDHWKNHILGSADSEIWILLATMALTVQKVKEAFSRPHSSLSNTHTYPEFF